MSVYRELAMLWEPVHDIEERLEASPSPVTASEHRVLVEVGQHVSDIQRRLCGSSSPLQAESAILAQHIQVLATQVASDELTDDELDELLNEMTDAERDEYYQREETRLRARLAEQDREIARLQAERARLEALISG